MFVLRREVGGLPEFMTLKPEYTTGNALCAWCADPKTAFGFARLEDAVNFNKHFHHWFDHRTQPVEVEWT